MKGRARPLALRRISPLRAGLSLERDSVDGILLDILVEVLVAHKLLHTSLAQSVRVQDLEKFLELIYILGVNNQY
jgi:hypothetical protein